MYWLTFLVALAFIGFEVGMFLVNKQFGGQAVMSATNVEVAVVTICGWWYVGVSNTAAEIRSCQNEIRKLAGAIPDRQMVKTIDTLARFQLTYFWSKKMMI